MFNRKSLTSLLLAVVLTMTATMGMKCSPEQKKVATDLSITTLSSMLSRVDKPFVKDIILPGVVGFQKNPSADVWQRGLNAFDEVIARHDLSLNERDIVNLARGIFAAFNPIAAPESLDEGDAKAKRKALEREFEKLERAVEREAKK